MMCVLHKDKYCLQSGQDDGQNLRRRVAAPYRIPADSVSSLVQYRSK